MSITMKLFFKILIVLLCLSSTSLSFARDNQSEITGDQHLQHGKDYIVVGPNDVTILDPSTHQGSHLLFLNRCLGGLDLTPGQENSRKNHTPHARVPLTLDPYQHDDKSWTEVVRHVRDILYPFNIEITDQDPCVNLLEGETCPNHFEAAVCGSPANFGMNVPGLGGFASFTCAGVIENSIAFIFPLAHNGSRHIAETVVHEVGHNFGLDHLFDCSDPMTYLSGCGEKYFQDKNNVCGTFQRESCSCGRQQQNSYQTLLNILGEGYIPTPPHLSFVELENGSSVDIGFTVRAEVSDPDGIAFVQLLVDEEEILTLDFGPYIFDTPRTLFLGEHTVTLIAEDNHGAQQIKTIVVSNDITSDDEGCHSNNHSALVALIIALGLLLLRRHNKTYTSISNHAR